MAPPVRAEVALTSLQNCLVNLPPGLIALISNTNIPAQNVVVELQYRTQTLSSGAISSGNTAGFPKISLCRMDWHAQSDQASFAPEQ